MNKETKKVVKNMLDHIINFEEDMAEEVLKDLGVTEDFINEVNSEE